ncbi:hypothetical protein H5410_020248, partial [Solanum commersonii]
TFENKGPEMLNDVDALADGEKGRGTYAEIKKKRAMDASERELFSNKKQVMQYVSDKPISTDACANISNTNNINATSLEHGKGKVILMRDNSGKEKNHVNHDKDIDVGSKKKVQNTFPAHVKSLLSSGLLDGVPVKYISMLSEKSLIGVIEGNGYLCSCDNCKLSEATFSFTLLLFVLANFFHKKNYLSASEFERHAGCKSGHANSHIYFDSGKTIHTVVQKLKKTPPEMLFEVIQNIVGSPISPKNFQTFNVITVAIDNLLRRLYKCCQISVAIGQISSSVVQSFENKGPEMLKDVDALVDGEKGRGNVEIEKKCAMDASKRELFSNKKQVVQCVSDKPISTDACTYISNTNSINATSLEHGKGKVISIGDNSGKGKNPVNHDKDIGADSKKKVQNTFPTNVKSLLSSGLLDGVPKSLMGVIKGNGYLCSCDNCKLSEARFSFTLLLFMKNCLSSTEFERHAGCKSHHANSHIYLQSAREDHLAKNEAAKPF